MLAAPEVVDAHVAVSRRLALYVAWLLEANAPDSVKHLSVLPGAFAETVGHDRDMDFERLEELETVAEKAAIEFDSCDDTTPAYQRGEALDAAWAIDRDLLSSLPDTRDQFLRLVGSHPHYLSGIRDMYLIGILARRVARTLDVHYGPPASAGAVAGSSAVRRSPQALKPRFRAWHAVALLAIVLGVVGVYEPLAVRHSAVPRALTLGTPRLLHGSCAYRLARRVDRAPRATPREA